MSSPSNIFDALEQNSQVSDDNLYYDIRNENDVNGKILYTGICPVVRGNVDAAIWYIRMLQYDANGFLSYVQMPVNGPGFKYSWTNRATYFI